MENINYNSSDTLKATSLNTAFDKLYDATANYFSGEAFGLMNHPNGAFDLTLTGDVLRLQTATVRFPNGHVYATDQQYGLPQLDLSQEDFSGHRYVYLIYEGREAAFSQVALGKTVRKDIRLPKVTLMLSESRLNAVTYPQVVLLGVVEFTTDEGCTIMLDRLPPLLHVGAHPAGQELLAKTKRYWQKMDSATNEILRQLSDLPPNSMYADLVKLAEKLDTLLTLITPQLNHLSHRSSLVETSKLWSVIAGAFLRHLSVNHQAKRPKESLLVINQNVSLRGGFQVLGEDLFELTTKLANHTCQPFNQEETIALIQQFLSRVIFAWAVLGDGHPIPLHQAQVVKELF